MPESPVLLGLEQEFRLRAAGRPLDFRRLIRRALAPRRSVVFRNLPEARLLDAGYVAACDEAEAEFAIAPVHLDRGGLERFGAEAVRCRVDLLGLLHGAGVEEVLGYSTHLSVSVPCGLEDTVAWTLATTVGPALVALVDGPRSPGLLIRPFRGRIEIGGEYIDDPAQLTAAIAVLAGCVAALHRTDGRRPADWPRVRLRRWEPGIIRGGIYLPRDAYGPDIHRRGRAARVHLESGGDCTVGELLERAAEIGLAQLGRRRTRGATRLVERAAAETGFLQLDRRADSVERVRAREASPESTRLARAFGAIPAGAAERGLRPRFVDWDGAAFGLADDRDGRLLVVARHRLADVIAAAEDGRLEQVVADLPARRGDDGVFRHLDQLSDSAVYASIDLRSLSREVAEVAAKPPPPPPPPPPDDRPCSVSLDGPNVCAGEEADFTASSPDPGTFDFFRISGSFTIVAVAGDVCTVRGGAPGVARLGVTFTRADGAACSTSVDFLVKGAVLVPADRVDQPPPRPATVALFQHRPVLRLDGVAGADAELEVASYRATPLVGGGAGAHFEYEVVLAGVVDDPTGVVRDIWVEWAADDPDRHTVSIDADLRFTATLRVRGLGEHRVGLAAMNGIGRVGRIRILVEIGLRPDDQARISTAYDRRIRLRASAEAAMDRQSWSPRRDLRRDQGIRRLLARRMALRQERADRAVRRAEERPRIVARSDQVVPPVETEGVEYRVLAVGESEGFAAVKGPDETVRVAMRAVPGRRHVFLSADPERLVFVRGSGAVGTGMFDRDPPELRALFADAGDTIDVAFEDCRGRATAYGLAIDAASATMALLEDAAANATAVVAASATPIPETIDGRAPRVSWEVVSAVPGWAASDGGRTGAGRRFDFRTRRDGTFLLRAVCRYGDDGGTAVAGYHRVSVYRGSVRIFVPDARQTLATDRRADRRELGPLEVTDEALTRRVVASLDLRRHPLADPPPSPALRTRWRWRRRGRPGALRAVSHSGAGTVAIAEFDYTAEPGRLQLSAQLLELRAGTDEIPIGGLGREVRSPVVDVVPGPATTLRLEGSRDGGRSWHPIPLREWAGAELSPARMTSDLPAPLRFEGRGRTPHLLLRLAATDARGQSLRDGTPVFWQLRGGGALGPGVDPAVGRLENGYARRRLENGLDPGRQILIVEVGALRRWFGDLTRAVDFDFELASPVEVAQTGEKLVSLTPGASRVRVTCRVGPDGAPVPAGTPVRWTVSQGSVDDPDLGHYAPAATTTTDEHGRAEVALSPLYHAPDGTRNYLRREAWGELHVTAAIGSHSARGGPFRYEPWKSDVKPLVMLPHSGMVRQNDLGWMRRPVASDTDLATAGRDHVWRVRGRTGETAINHLLQEPDFFRLARFPARIVAGRIPGRTGPGYRRSVDLQVGGQTFTGPRVTTGADGARQFIRVHDTLRDPIRLRSDRIDGLTSFELEFELRIDGQLNAVSDLFGSAQFNEFVLVQGGGPRDDLGGWRIVIEWGVDTYTAHFDYWADGCTNRARVSHRLSVEDDIDGWTRFRVSARGNPKPVAGRRGWVGLELEVGTNPTVRWMSREFNWIPGEWQRFRFNGSRRNHYDVSGLVLRHELNRNWNFDRFGDGEVLSPIVIEELQGAGRESDLNLRIVRSSAAPPSFSDAIETFATFTSQYCRQPDQVIRVDIAALNDAGQKAYRHTSDLVWAAATGEGTGWAAFAGEVVANIVGWGDVRDVGKNAVYAAVPGGEEANWLDFTLAVLGILGDAAQYLTAGAALPANAAVGVARPTLKQLDNVGDSVAALKPMVDEIGGVMAREARELVWLWRAGRFGIRGAELVLSTAPLLQALLNYVLEDPDVRRNLPALAQFGNELTKLVPTPRVEFLELAPGHAVTPSSLPVPVLSFSFPDPAALRDGGQAVLAIARAVVERIEALITFFNTSVHAADEMVGVIRYLTKPDLPGDLLGMRRVAVRRIPAVLRGAAPNAAKKRWDEVPELVFGLSPRQLNRTLLVLSREAPDAALTRDALRGLACFRYLIGEAELGEVVRRIKVFGPAGNELLQRVGRRLNSVYSAALWNPTHAADDIRRMLRGLASGTVYGDARVKEGLASSLQGKIHEIDIVDEFYSAIRRQGGGGRIFLAPPYRFNARWEGADGVLDLDDHFGALPPGRWVSEMKAYYPRLGDTADVARRRTTIETQFESRIDETIDHEKLDFAFFFRGRSERSWVDGIRSRIDAAQQKHGAIAGYGIRVQEPDGVFHLGEWRHDSTPHYLRVFVRFDGLPNPLER